MSSPQPLTYIEVPPDDDRAEVLAGLRAQPRQVSPKYFYDERGSRLFDAICRQPEYYPTRTELAIMREHGAAMAACVGPAAMLVEYGSGSSLKTRVLLDALDRPAAYVPVDISGEHLAAAAAKLAADYPGLEVLPVCADFTRPLALPEPARAPARVVVYFPGSTIGNFARDEATGLLRQMRELAGDSGGLLIGVDLVKPRAVLEAAYNDAAGVTAAFNLNLLRHLNREFAADFDLNAFRHRAVYDEAHDRIEMRLVSLRRQTVRVNGSRLTLEADEFIVTEHSHKYTPAGFAGLAAAAGWHVAQVWTDPQQLFSVQYLAAA